MDILTIYYVSVVVVFGVGLVVGNALSSLITEQLKEKNREK